MEYKIDPELNEVLPKLSDEDYKALEQSLLADGFKGAPIMVWGDVIVDGHNRYGICKKHNIPYEVKSVEFAGKEDAIIWMVRQQLGRRSLTPLQRIKIVEEYRPFYKKKAKANQSKAGKVYGIGSQKLSENSTTAITEQKLSENSTTAISKEEKIDVRAELAKNANVSTDTYTKGMEILKSGNEELINETISGRKSINKAFNELKKSAGTANDSDTNSGVKDIQGIQRKEVAKKIRDTREKHVVESPEYEDAKAVRPSEEIQINGIENAVRDAETNEIESKLIQIQNRYHDYLLEFQEDVKWLSDKAFYRDDGEDVSGKTHSELQNCLERFKGISNLMENMVIDEFGCITIKK